MELLKTIMKLAENNVSVDYTIINQKENGTFEEGEQNITYTISVHDKWTFGDVLFAEAGFTNLEEGLRLGIKKGEKYLKERMHGE